MKVFKALYWALVFISLSVTTWAQRGKHGALTVTAANTRINEYTNLTANATAGNLTITVGSNNLNANSRFTAPLQVGDLIMIIQMQGALIKTFNTVPGQDSTYGEILNYNDCGRYEFHQVYALPNATSIVLDCGLQYNYSSAGKTQIVRVPRLSALTVNAGASLTGDAWNGTIGGIVSAEVNGATVINGSVVATGLGFRQGIAANDGNYGGLRYVDMNVGYPEGGEKGESIAGSQADYAALYNGKHSRGAPANGGGGGNSHNAGGGGGANAGIPATWRGYGIVNPAYNASYNLEFPGRAAIVSSGGGKGGYAYSSANLNPATVGPNNGSWGGDGRKNNGGFGGRPLDYSTGRIFLGGGGGAGHVNNLSAVNTGGNGGNGGGMIYFISYGNVTGTGAVIANGNNGVTATGAPTPGNFAGNDSGGGGGAGGTIIFNSTGTVSGISLTANGGLGGNQTIVKNLVFGTVNEAEGPGGGGGGGYIALSAGAPVQNVLGANSGTTNAPPMATFPPNGATNGAPGLSNQSITLYTLTANPVTVCVNNAATLTASSNNPSASFLWYNNIAGPSQIATGAVYTTSVFTAPGSYTFFAAMCPGNYRIPVVVTVTNGPTLTVTSSTICAGQTTTLTASGATTYSWSTGASTSTVAVNPALTTAYTVTGSLSGCSSFTTTTVTVNAASTIAVTSTVICAGQTATLTAGPALSYTWSNGATTSANVVTPALTTVYSLTANIGGCNATNTGTVTVNPAPVTNVNSATICAGNSATLTASGATSYSWSTGALTNSIVVTPAANTSYTVTGTQGGCSSSTVAQVVVSAVGVLPVNSTTICAGQSATLTAGAATSYTWSTGANTSSIVVTPASTTVYTVNATTGGCVSNATAAVTVNPSSTIAVTSSTVCAGQTATLTAGPAISYTWSNGATSSTNAVTPALTTVYSLTANIGGCNATNTGTVTVNPAPVTNVNSATICAGNSATLTASGATSYSWSTGALTNSIVVTPAANTSYTVTGTLGGCSSSTVAQVIVSAVGALPVNSATICAGQSATLTAGAATSYTWSTGANTSSIVVTPASTTVYTVNATTGGCVSNATTAVTVNPSSTIAVTSSTVCAGQTATLTAGPALSYTWSNGATSSTNAVTPALTTVYSLTANIGGCNATNSGTVTVNPIPVTSASNATICAGNSATLTASGATSYSWSTGTLTNSIVVTPAANTSYTVTGTQGGCSSSTVVAVTISSIGAIAINNPTICTGQTATLTAAAATSYSWSTGATTSSITVSPGLTSIYTLSAVVGGCPSLGSATVTVVAPSVPVVNQASVCSGQTATLTAMGASSYSWSTGALTNSIVVSPVSTTIYTVTGNPGSCPANANTTVFVTNTPTVSANSLTICSGQTATLIASGAASYLWNDGTPTASNVVTPVSTAVYTVTGTTGTCSASATAMVIVNPTPTVSAINATICPGQTATVTPSGATQYTFDPGGINAVGTTFTVSPAVTTVYAISGSSNNCVSTGTVSINLGNNLSIAVNNATFCPGNSVVLTASSSATSYTWSTGATTASISVSPSVASVYSVTGSNGSCSGSTTVQVLPGSVPAITVTATPICPGQTSTLSASGANTYTWLPSASISSSIVSSPSAATAYTVIGNSGACDGSSVFTLTISPTPTVSVASVSVCNGGTATLTANGATNYNWLPSGSAGNTLAVTPSVTSTYTVVGSIGSCTSLATATVSLVSGFNLSINSSNICLGQSATLTASAGNTFTWSTGETTASIVVTPSVSTNYSVTAALGSCINSTATTVYVSTPLALSVSPASSEICNGQSIALTASGASSYTWSPGNLTTPVVSVSPSATTIYTVNSTNGICTTSRTLAVFVNTYPTLSVSINTFEICRGEDIIVNANGAANYTLSTPKFNHYTLPHSFKPDANTTLTVTGSNGACTRSTTAFITVHSVDAGFNEEINYADFPAYINFTNTSSPNSSVSWDFGNGISMGNIQTPRVLFEDPRKYLVSLVAIDAFGCKDTVMKVIEAGCGSGDIYVPNSFTPNGDGINDVFAIAGPGVCIANFKGRIFDRWGELLFTMEELSSKWDGQFKGNPVEQGVYVYQFEYQVPGGKTISRTGHINLIR